MDRIIADRDRSGRFVVGNDAREAKHRRIAEKIRQLTVDYDASTPAQKLMLLIAAKHLDTAETTRSAPTRERSTNVGLRCLAKIPPPEEEAIGRADAATARSHKRRPWGVTKTISTAAPSASSN